MRYAIQVTVGSANKLVPLSYLRDHLRLDQPFDEGLLLGELSVATRLAEQWMNKSILTQTLQLTLSQADIPFQFFSGYAMPFSSSFYNYNSNYNNASIVLPYGRVQAVTAVTRGYFGQDDETLTEGSDYFVNLETGQVTLFSNNFMGSNYWAYGDHLDITYTAGYGDTMEAVPTTVVHGVLLLVANLYRNRGDEGRSLLTSAIKSMLGFDSAPLLGILNG
jgi:hypothetical protein